MGPQVDVEDDIPLLVGTETRRADDPGVRDVDVDRAEFGFGQGYQALDVSGRGRIGTGSDGGAARRSDRVGRRGGLTLVDVADHHAGPGCAQSLRDGPADT